MLKVDRSDIVLVWKNRQTGKLSCSYCRLRDKISKVDNRVNETNGMCPVGPKVCNHEHGRFTGIYKNTEDIILTTIFECRASCGKLCLQCAANKLIEFIRIHNEL